MASSKILRLEIPLGEGSRTTHRRSRSAPVCHDLTVPPLDLGHEQDHGRQFATVPATAGRRSLGLAGSLVPMPATSVQDLVFTLFGDYLLTQPRPIPVRILIDLLGRLGVEPQAVRTALSRMCARGWLSRRRSGRDGVYDLTDKGRVILEEGRERIYGRPSFPSWDGNWCVVSYSIPEGQRQVRDRLRTRLTWLGFGPLASGVWISPHDHSARVLVIARQLDVSAHLELFRGPHLGGSLPPELVATCWDLASIDEEYVKFLQRWEPYLEHCSVCRAAGAQAIEGLDGVPCLSPEGCFRRRFQLVHDFRRFPTMDPFLPVELLPQDWHGAAAARVFETYHRVLSPSAEAFVARLCADADMLSEPFREVPR